jgi:hypothetical protein
MVQTCHPGPGRHADFRGENPTEAYDVLLRRHDVTDAAAPRQNSGLPFCASC